MWAIQIDAPGGPEVLRWREVADPVVGPGVVVAEVATAGLNYIDTYQRSGLYEVPMPYVPGLEGTGTVVAVGPDVEHLAVGDRIAWATCPGSYAERVALPAAQTMRVPDGVPTDVAATIPLQGMTAHFLAVDTFPLTARHRCLVHAGAGGVGLLLIQIAKLRGAEVFTTVGSAEKAALVEAAGADHTIRYRDVDFVDAVRSITGEERPLDVVYDGVGQSTFRSSLSLIRRRGTMVTFGNASGPVEPISPLELSANGSLFLTRPTLFHHITTREEIQRRADDLFGWVADGRLEIRVGARYPLREAGAAHRALESRATTGKVLLEP